MNRLTSRFCIGFILWTALPLVAQDNAPDIPPPPEGSPQSGDAAAAETRPALGVRFLQGLDVVLTEVVVGSPAEFSGLRPGDQIVAVNEEVVASSDHFIALVAAAPYEEPLEIAYVRNQERHWASVELAGWDTVFASTTAHVAMRPALEAAVVPAVTYYAAPYIATNVSPVVVPAAWYYPAAYPWFWGYPYWAYPYYSVSSAFYSPGWYYAQVWPYWYPGYLPAPRIAVPAARTDSAQHASPPSTRAGLATQTESARRNVVEQQ